MGRMKEMINTYITLVRENSRETSSWKSTLIWEENIKMDVRNKVCENGK
jgi:hypothetical protein